LLSSIDTHDRDINDDKYSLSTTNKLSIGFPLFKIYIICISSINEQVMEQAYLYRVASAINMKKIPLVEDPGSVQLLKGLKKGRIQMFASSMTEVEELHAGQLNRLMKALNIDRLPPGVSISDPAVLPILYP